MAKLKGCVTTLERNPTTAPLAGKKPFVEMILWLDDADAILKLKAQAHPCPYQHHPDRQCTVCRGNE